MTTTKVRLDCGLLKAFLLNTIEFQIIDLIDIAMKLSCYRLPRANIEFCSFEVWSFSESFIAMEKSLEGEGSWLVVRILNSLR